MTIPKNGHRFSEQDRHGDDRRRSMSLISEDPDPSELRAAARPAAATPPPNRVTFNRLELNRILNLYGRMVADGEWPDYDPDFLRVRAAFALLRCASEALL